MVNSGRRKTLALIKQTTNNQALLRKSRATGMKVEMLLTSELLPVGTPSKPADTISRPQKKGAR